MRIRFRHIWEVATTGYWFVPALMTLCAVILAFLMLYIDRQLLGKTGLSEWLYTGGPDGAKVLLSALAGSVITVASVVFSITIAALTQASAQFGPRLLRNFMRDTGNQVVLGTFVATFMYCLLVLRTIHDKIDNGQQFVPNASVTVAVLLAILSIGVLIFFIHHVSVSLQAPAVVAAVLAELYGVVDRLPSDQTGAGTSVVHVGDGDDPEHEKRDALAVAATRQGYIQAIDYAALIAAAEEANVTLRLEYRPGDYVIECGTLLHASPAQNCHPQLAERLNSTFICGRHATAEQDVEHAIRQIVEIAVRALSPGINDPFTAINCIDALGSAICRVARRGLPGPLMYGPTGKLRLITPVTTFPGIVDAAFNQIRQYGRNSVAVTIRLLEVIARCAEQVRPIEQREALLKQAEIIYGQSLEATPEQKDRDDIALRWAKAAQALRD